MPCRKIQGNRPVLVVLLASVAGSLLGVRAGAIEFKAGQHVTVPADEVIDGDLYATGETVTIDGKTVTIDGTVRGDVVASGREVRVNGSIEGDLMACGQAVVRGGPHPSDSFQPRLRWDPGS
jgi:hypothetical protein